MTLALQTSAFGDTAVDGHVANAGSFISHVATATNL